MSQHNVSIAPSKSPSQPLPKVTTAQTPITTQRILQMSHMELLYEGARPEPRLRRLLGHASAYQNASRGSYANKRKSIFYIDEKKEKVQNSRAAMSESHQNRVNLKGATTVQRCRTLSKSQAAISSQLRQRQLSTVNATEVDGGSDDSDLWDLSNGICESYSSDDDDDDDDDDELYNDYDNDTSVHSHNRNPGIERLGYLARGLSLKDGGNNTNRIEISTYTSTKAEQGDDRGTVGIIVASS